jgi:hypothetical protein
MFSISRSATMTTRTPKLPASLIGVAALLFVFTCGLGVRAQDLNKPSKIELGVQFSTLTLGPASPSGPTLDFAALPFNHSAPGIGGRFTLNLTKHLALESEGNFFPRQLSLGGHALQAQFGVKAGHRFKRIGIFAKARPGFVSFSKFATEEGTESVGLPPFQFTVARIAQRRRYFFSMDIGGVAEFYLSHRIFARVDGGDTIIRYGKGLFYDFDETTPQSPGQTKHNFQFTAGVGFRF